MNRLLLILRFYTTGCFTISAGDFIGVSKTCAFGIIEEVTEAIVSLRHEYIRMPNSPEEMMRISGKFSQMARFPRVIGVVDGTNIRMQSIGKFNFMIGTSIPSFISNKNRSQVISSLLITCIKYYHIHTMS